MLDLLVRQCWHITTKERFRGWTTKMGNGKKRQDNSKINTLIWKRCSYILILFVLMTSIVGCGSIQNFTNNLLRPERIVPVFDPDATIAPQSGTVIYEKNGIVVMVVPLPEIKNVDAFGVLIHNRTGHWISFEKEKFWMQDQAGNIVKQLSKAQEATRLKKNFKPKFPPEFAADVFRWDRTISIQGDYAVLPTEDLKKTNVMPRRTVRFAIYFSRRSLKSKNLRIVIPGVTSEFNDQQTTFTYRFRVQR